jgi:hypothetical protein
VWLGQLKDRLGDEFTTAPVVSRDIDFLGNAADLQRAPGEDRQVPVWVPLHAPHARDWLAEQAKLKAFMLTVAGPLQGCVESRAPADSA